MHILDKEYKKLTIILEKDFYSNLKKKAGRGNIGKYITNVVKPYILNDKDLKIGYELMSKDKDREKDALVWSESLIGDYE